MNKKGHSATLKPCKPGETRNPGGLTKNQRLLKQAWAEYLETDISLKSRETGKTILIKRLDAIFKLFDEALFAMNEKWALEFAMNHIAPKSVEVDTTGNLDAFLETIIARHNGNGAG